MDAQLPHRSRREHKQERKPAYGYTENPVKINNASRTLWLCICSTTSPLSKNSKSSNRPRRQRPDCNHESDCASAPRGRRSSSQRRCHADEEHGRRSERRQSIVRPCRSRHGQVHGMDIRIKRVRPFCTSSPANARRQREHGSPGILNTRTRKKRR